MHNLQLHHVVYFNLHRKKKHLETVDISSLWLHPAYTECGCVALAYPGFRASTEAIKDVETKIENLKLGRNGTVVLDMWPTWAQTRNPCLRVPLRQVMAAASFLGRFQLLPPQH